MNDNTPCVVWTREHGYSEVMTFKAADELAQRYAWQGHEVQVYKLSFWTTYGGYSQER